MEEINKSIRELNAAYAKKHDTEAKNRTFKKITRDALVRRASLYSSIKNIIKKTLNRVLK